MKTSLTNLKQQLMAFHNDEEGVEPLQIVMLLAIGAAVVVTLWAFWDQIKSQADKWLGQATKN